MAALIGLVPYSTVALSAATAKTVAGINPASNYRARVLEAAISFDGSTSSNAPVVVDFGKCTFATNAPGTNSTSVTPLAKDQDATETFQTAAGKNWTTEPTVVSPLQTIDVGQFNGLYHYICPFAAPFVVTNNKGFVIRANSPNNVNCSGKIEFEE